MKQLTSEELVIVSSVGAISGVTARSLGLSTGNRVFDAIAGGAVALVGWYMDMDGVGDFVEAAGIGYLLASVL